MTLFAQQHNGTIRRVRGTFGGSQAWKQHEKDGVDENGRDNHERRRLIEQLDLELANEQLRDALEARARRARRNRQPKPFTVHSRKEQVAAPKLVPVTRKTRLSLPIKAVISESGKIIAVPAY